MDEKKEINEIRQAIKDLGNRCRELNLNLAVSFSEEKGNAIGTMLVGDPIELFILLQHFNETLKKRSKMTSDELINAFLLKQEGCGCPRCRAKRAAENERENSPASMDEIKSMLINILGGMES
ncbi:hypothetical protein [Enterococcus caccae]|uniref:Uncharacterized protein n=1 Tax=Enterococcus caccae ATCC BAA-1240 TaxID=1158612 RepID=R3TXB1_9ENTE|nr:hypothetical protein [Enterococcus caccae]EOL45773.1 hypothetical protein UC7_01570 [Enterococcus caccae ATCC BAA-1240]EOT60969.1 hypothetical protein I580_01871 [Enterococcus caccae ATCC BAA-1240]OJG27996.1 hypothetical protein RU98_GL002205 [Enterococcus caccae]